MSTQASAPAQRSLFRRSMGAVFGVLFLTWLALVARELIDISLLQVRNGQAENALWAGLSLDRARETAEQPEALRQALERLDGLRDQEWRQKGYRPPFRLLQVLRRDQLLAELQPDLAGRDRVLPQEDRAGEDSHWLYVELRDDARELVVRRWQERPGDWHFSLAGLSYFARPLLYALPLLVLPLWLLFRLGFAPLQRMGSLISQRSAQDLTPLPPTPYQELAPLVNAVNSLMLRLQQRMEREHEFLVDAAHELKTPLAVVQLGAEALERGDAGSRQEACERLRQGVQRATHTVHQLLALARSGADALELSKYPHDLVELLRDRIALSSGLAVRRHIELELDSPEHLLMWLNRESMGSLIDNLVDNAIKYSPDGGHVFISLSQEPGAFVLRVSDQGAGIPAELRARVFERFVRLDAARCHGSGLGLTIVERAAGQHGAEVRLMDGPGGRGLSVVVSFPERMGG
ncbi:two-component sensor histidine kinase [Paucibacter sp. KBW04]|uniref:sensor histidine kinase n=1 Tax=Paucibacter sp. KBW04 TaxID=2153361 RepID=UPI000F5610F2|nr:HAMP domain-containing sensor histidine kinase [Paucibacter sp. KBW04]RQO61140.1 two-component sensor histidine kinase [Paucibacter sp. KBW04]